MGEFDFEGVDPYAAAYEQDPVGTAATVARQVAAEAASAAVGEYIQGVQAVENHRRASDLAVEVDEQLGQELPDWGAYRERVAAVGSAYIAGASTPSEFRSGLTRAYRDVRAAEAAEAAEADRRAAADRFKEIQNAGTTSYSFLFGD